jgi:hypothetical protein
MKRPWEKILIEFFFYGFAIISIGGWPLVNEPVTLKFFLELVLAFVLLAAYFICHFVIKWLRWYKALNYRDKREQRDWEKKNK